MDTKTVKTSGAKPATTVKMVRPEDRQPEPCVAEVPEKDVPDWQAQGWAVKAD